MLVLVALLSQSGCASPSAVQCSDGRTCPAGYSCDESSNSCVLSSRLKACADRPEGDECSFDGRTGHCEAGMCEVPPCGDGIIAADEVCDDGNNSSGDGCSSTCDSKEVCGNGIIDVDVGETCDDGLPEGSLESDDLQSGALLSGDGCSSRCRIESPTWTRMKTLSPRYGHALAYDVGRERAVLFGGRDAERRLGDTWEWDGSSWSERKPLMAPSPRWGHGLAYDVTRQRLVLFAGFHNSSGAAETWEWDGSSWTDLSPVNSPVSRWNHGLAYDAERRRVVLFGGENEAGVLGDTWEWDGSAWTEVGQASSPEARTELSLAYDAERKRVVLFGGRGEAGRLADTWEWDGTGWLAVPTDAPPAARSGHAIAYDPSRRRVVLLSGRGETDLLGDTWEWDGATWTLAAPVGAEFEDHAAVYRPETDSEGNQTGAMVVFGGRLAGGAALGDAPSAELERESFGFAYDIERQRSVLHAGSDVGSKFDTWEWDGASWTKVSVAPLNPSPPTTFLLYDSDRSEMVLVGSDSSTWFRTGGGEWTTGRAESSPNCARCVAAYNPSRERGVMVGSDKTWEWDGGAWTDAGEVPRYIPSNAVHSLAYDAARQEVLFFGDANHNETWTWDGAWTGLSPAVSPIAREYASLSYDARRQTVLMFGGHSGEELLADTWEWDGASWTELSPEQSPPARSSHGQVYDSARGQTVLVGGSSTSNDVGAPFGGTDVRDDTWTFRFEASEPHERCDFNEDADQDGSVGCDDPDCWGICKPLCPPATACDTSRPHCGDGACDSYLETHLSCPGDCPRPVLCGDFLCDLGEDCPADC